MISKNQKALLKKPIVIVLLIAALSTTVACTPVYTLNQGENNSTIILEDWEKTTNTIENQTLLSLSLFSEEEQDELQGFIAEVLAHNPDLQSLISTAQAAQYQYKQASGYALPTLNATIDANRTHLGKENFAESKITNTVRPALRSSWALDIWGKLSDAQEAARLLGEKSFYDLQHAQSALVIQAKQGWLQHIEQHQKQQQLQALAAIYEQHLRHQEERYAAGLTAFDTYRTAKTRLTEHRVRLKYTSLAVIETKQILNILRGQAPNTPLHIKTSSFSKKHLKLPTKINAKVLANRPDILAAFSQAKAFDYSARSAHKAILPQINLSGEIYKSGTSLIQAFNNGIAWQLIGGLTQPIFKGGQLLAKAKEQSAEAETSWWQYQALILKAIKEVEQAMNQDIGLIYQIKEQQQMTDDKSRILELTTQAFSEGNTDYTQYITAQINLIESEIQQAEVYFNFLNNRLSLIESLGLPLHYSAQSVELMHQNKQVNGGQ